MRSVDFESVFSKMADRAMAAKRAQSGAGDAVRVDWNFYRVRYGKEWRTCQGIDLLMGCTLKTVYAHLYQKKKLYDKRKGTSIMLVRVKS